MTYKALKQGIPCAHQADPGLPVQLCRIVNPVGALHRRECDSFSSSYDWLFCSDDAVKLQHIAFTGLENCRRTKLVAVVAFRLLSDRDIKVYIGIRREDRCDCRILNFVGICSALALAKSRCRGSSFENVPGGCHKIVIWYRQVLIHHAHVLIDVAHHSLERRQQRTRVHPASFHGRSCKGVGA